MPTSYWLVHTCFRLEYVTVVPKDTTGCWYFLLHIDATKMLSPIKILQEIAEYAASPLQVSLPRDDIPTCVCIVTRTKLKKSADYLYFSRLSMERVPYSRLQGGLLSG